MCISAWELVKTVIAIDATIGGMCVSSASVYSPWEARLRQWMRHRCFGRRRGRCRFKERGSNGDNSAGTGADDLVGAMAKVGMKELELMLSAGCGC